MFTWFHNESSQSHGTTGADKNTPTKQSTPKTYVYFMGCRYNAVQQNMILHTELWDSHKSEFVVTIDTPYLALTGELWGVYCEGFEGNWPRYNGTALYVPWAQYSRVHISWDILYMVCYIPYFASGHKSRRDEIVYFYYRMQHKNKVLLI